MDFTNDKYIATLEKAQRYLVRAKSCSMCENAQETIDRDSLRVCNYCTRYHKDVTGKCGFMCGDFTAKPINIRKVN